VSVWISGCVRHVSRLFDSCLLWCKKCLQEMIDGTFYVINLRHVEAIDMDVADNRQNGHVN